MDLNLNHYECKISETHLDYEFYSEGPKGRIRKMIRFTLLKKADLQYYNLCFGDITADKAKIDDFIVTDNKDAERILATVAAAIVEFTNRFPDALVYAEGSTQSRTRLYQMGINKYWKEINKNFDVFGLTEDMGFVHFRKNHNYAAFVVRRKKLIL